MARKLSPITCRPHIITIAAITWLAARGSLAQSEIQVTQPNSVVENPYAAPQEPIDTDSLEWGQRQRREYRYRRFIRWVEYGQLLFFATIKICSRRQSCTRLTSRSPRK